MRAGRVASPAMREVIAVCRSRKSARERVATVLDRYFWRIGDRTWRGRASNACLDRVARELRDSASRATAVSIQEIRSSHESRMPLIRIGSRKAFSADGQAPVASHPAEVGRMSGTASEQAWLAIIRIAVLFHDVGKATRMFQAKLRAAIKGGDAIADAIRHEVISAAVWDELCGVSADEDIPDMLSRATPGDIDAAWERAANRLGRMTLAAGQPLEFRFTEHPGSIAFAIGMLILTHHRLPDGDTNHTTITAGQHVRRTPDFSRAALTPEPGTPIWHEEWWLRRLRRDAPALVPGIRLYGLDISLRASLMFADHIGSALKQPWTGPRPEHLANTTRPGSPAGRSVPADSLSLHVRRVYAQCRPAFDALVRSRHGYPALSEEEVPRGVLAPPAGSPRFEWQSVAAAAAREICLAREGGFFGCILAGTGTGKTRGAPAILANASLYDARPERRYFRMTLALGLRVLASQSALEYVEALGFQPDNVNVLIGKQPIAFRDETPGDNETSGSESLDADILPESLQVERAGGRIPRDGDTGEDDWLRGLSLDTDRRLPAFISIAAEHAGRRGRALLDLAGSPVLVATVDHVMPVASPVRSAFLASSIRVLTSDLILDEIDQYGAEDLAAIARLVYQVGAAGRRVIVMSATLTHDIAEAFHDAYAAGWAAHAAAAGVDGHVHVLCTGDAPGSCMTNAAGVSFRQIYDDCRAVVLDGLSRATPLRRGEILPVVDGWRDLVGQIDASCSQMHDRHATVIAGFRVSIGLVRMSRISHTAALALQLSAGSLNNGRLRVKVCLHSNFPRLNREWIEMRLKRALTRKGDDPDDGLRALCEDEGLFARAMRLGTREIEIIAVTSPVVETGNDLDFDYAIVDPVSMRSIVQSAGRVRRHRPGAAEGTNFLILGKSPIVQQSGKLQMPGVETRQSRSTGVGEISFGSDHDRSFSSLAGGLDFGIVTAGAVLSDVRALLKDAEQQLRASMLDVAGSASPLGCYLRQPVSRLTRRLEEMRRFRRSTTKNVECRRIGHSLEISEWMINPDPGQGGKFRPLTYSQVKNPAPEELLFSDVTRRALMAVSGEGESASGEDGLRLIAAEIAVYGDEIEPPLAYSEFTGFTRGTADDLESPFGKRMKNS